MALEAINSRTRGLRAREERVSGIAVVQRLDWILLAALGVAVAYGIWAINGITLHDVGGSAVTRQIEYAVAGALVFVVVLFIDPDVYRRWRRPIYVGTTGVMLLVLATGAATRGSKRWINVGFFTFQPSEFGKVLFILVVAGVLADRSRSMSDPRTPLRAIAFGLVPILLVFVQPDIGTALVYTAGLLAVLFVSGVRWSQLAVLGAVATVAVLAVLWLLPAAGINVLKPYQAQRLTGFTHPSSDPRGATYNLRQSITAVGAGGLRGRGILGATQTRLNYLPEHATDFAFASLAEERGFFGVSILLLLYLLIVWRALKIVAGARDLYCAIVAGGITFMFLFQVFVNSAMTMGIAPITGIPLPFVSVGGSSMITNLLAMGVLQAIHARRGFLTPLVTKLGPLAFAKLLREVKPDGRPLALDGARELVPLLARELRAGGDAAAVVESFTENAAVLVWVGRADESALRTASRARVPIVGVTDAETLPYVLDTDLVRVPPGQGFPLGEIARVLARKLGDRGTSLAARLPVLRRAVCDELIASSSRRNAMIAAAVFIPGVDMPVLTLNQARLVLRIASAHGQTVDQQRLPELLGVLGAGFGFRAVARELLDAVPIAGWALKGGVAYAGTKAIGEAAVKYFETRVSKH